MKLELQQQFTIEIKDAGKEDEILTGTLAPLTKQMKKEFEANFERDKELSKSLQKLSTKLQRLLTLIDISESEKSDDLESLYKKYDKMESDLEKGMDELSTLDTAETASKKRIESCVNSDDMERIFELCDIVGHKAVLDTINKDIVEKQGNGIPA